MKILLPVSKKDYSLSTIVDEFEPRLSLFERIRIYVMLAILAGAMVGVAWFAFVPQWGQPLDAKYTPPPPLPRIAIDCPATPSTINVYHALSHRSGLTKIMCVGDSITVGSDEYLWTHHKVCTMKGGYRPYLLNLLASHNVAFVGSAKYGAKPWSPCEGHGGYTAGQLANIFNANDKNLHADIFLVEAGTNDCYKHVAISQSITDNVRLWNEIYRYNPNATVYVSTIPPTTLTAPYLDNKWIDNYNAVLKGLATIYASSHHRFYLVDLHDQAGWNTGDMGCIGIHPSDSGYRKMAAFWSKVLL